METMFASSSSSAPHLHDRVAADLARLIAQGTLRPGDRAPSVRDLSRQKGVSISTATQAYRELENQGLLEARPQSGYYVRARLSQRPPEPEMVRPPTGPTEVNLRALVMKVLQAPRDPELVNLGLALPNSDLLPTAQLNRIQAAIARRSGRRSNQYDMPPGCPELRTQIARRLIEAGCALSPDDVVTTCGCQEALQLCLRAVAEPCDLVAIESPTFFGILQILEALGMRAVEISTYPREGICLDALTYALDHLPIKACVFSLNHSNPLGSCMPEEKKVRLVELLAQRQVPLVEDDIYGALSFGPTRPRVAKAYDRHGLVLLCDSFSKTLAPGYRVGYAVPGRFKAQVEHLKYVSSGATATLPQLAIAEFLANGGYEHHLRKIRRVYADQVRLMTQAIGNYFPPGTKVTRPSGGSVLWVELPDEINSLALYERALAAKISIAPGPLFSAKKRFSNCIRLSCGNAWSEALERALMRLGEIIEQMRREAGSTAGLDRADEALLGREEQDSAG